MRRSEEPFADQLARLLGERGLSASQLARAAGISQSHLSTVTRRDAGTQISGDMAARIADVLGLPRDWFPETRKARLMERLERDAGLVDRLYDRLQMTSGFAQAEPGQDPGGR